MLMGTPATTPQAPPIHDPTPKVLGRRRKDRDPDAHDCHCLRCGYGWQARVPNPKRCPSCISPHWQTIARKGNYARGKDHPKVRDRKAGS